MKKYAISYVETMVSRGCNLSCMGCTSFCDYPHTGVFAWKDVEKDFLSWSQIIEPEVIGLIGGEPLLNPEIFIWIEGIRKYFEKSFILLVTNGLLYSKLEGVIYKLISNSPSKLMISLHKNEEEIKKCIEEIIKRSKYRFIKRVNHEELTNIEYILYDKTKKFSIQLRETDKFLKRYIGYGKDIFPYETNDFADAFKICVDRPIIYKGELFRCGKIPFVQETLRLMGKDDDENAMGLWKKCLEYEALRCNDNEEKKHAFFSSLHSPVPVCSTCPTEQDNAMILHKENVYSKEDWHLKFLAQETSYEKSSIN
mgnify:CR=1 FL=1